MNLDDGWRATPNDQNFWLSARRSAQQGFQVAVVNPSALRRRFVPRVDFVTSPGFLDGGDSRQKAGLLFGRVSRVVTNLGIMGFDEETKAMRLEALHAGVSVEDVIENTGFDLLISERVATTEPPSEGELALLRSLDPDRRFL